MVIQRLFMGSSGFIMAMDFKLPEYLLNQKDLKKHRCTISYQKPQEE